jgi:hypothetical protein
MSHIQVLTPFGMVSSTYVGSASYHMHLGRKTLEAMEERKKAHPNRSDKELQILRNKGPKEIQGMMVWEAMEYIKAKHGEATLKTMRKRGVFNPN